MSFLRHALRHATAGRRVFPLIQFSKLPGIEEFPTRATTDEATIRQWWFDDIMELENPLNVGISTDGLLVIDVDNKDGRNGDASLLALEMRGIELPETYEQTTPTGGRHIVFSSPVPISNSVQKIGPGLDVRGRGGFIVASGSVVEKGTYKDNGKPVVPAPQALIDLCGVSVERAVSAEAVAEVDEDAALKRFTDWLEHHAPRSIKGSGGDATAYQVACRGRDEGLSEALVLDAMLSESWDGGCGWAPDKLAKKVKHAFTYAKGAAGNRAPETEFSAVSVPQPAPSPAAPPEAEQPDLPIPLNDENHPVNVLNRDHAFVLIGSNHFVLWETTDYLGRYDLRYLEESSFHRTHTANKVPVERARSVELVPTTKLWMDAPARVTPPGPDEPALWRRSYRGVVFDPSGKAPPGYYNVWRGFAFEPQGENEPATSEARWSLDAWKEHLQENVCRGDASLTKWLTGWFAHAVQRPWEKPLVAVVMRGGKGTGKTTVAERFCALLGSHGLVTQDRRFMISNFNGHMERLLALVLDEAIWPGDKAGEGVLKGLVTGTEHLIERKGKEPYRVRNYTRVIIIGNEKWLVPASNDERRFAVFDIGDGRKQQNEWFERMRVGMENGGYRLLLRYLMDFDLTGIDVNRAPATLGLLAQKEESLEPLAQWWHECLVDGRITHADTPGTWPEQVSCDEIPHAISRYFRNRNISARVPSNVSIGRELRKLCPGIERKRTTNNGYIYEIPPLDVARKQWADYLNQSVTWATH
jgi:hypothetical protein